MSTRRASGLRRVAMNTAVQAAADLIGKLASLCFYIAIARDIGKAGFGQFTFSSAIGVVFVAFAAFGTDYLITREVARDAAAATRLVMQATWIKLGFGVTGVMGGILFAALTGASDEVLVAVALMSVATLVETLAKSLHAVFRGMQQTGPVALSLIVQRVGTAALGVPLLAAGADLVQVCTIYLVGAVLGAAWIVASTLRRSVLQRPSLRMRGTRAFLFLSAPIGLNEIFGVVMSRVDVGILALLKDDAAVGVYGAAYRLFESTLFLSWGFGIAALPAFSVLTRASTPTIGQALELGLKASTATLLPIGAVLTAFAPFILSTVYGPEYADAVGALRWLGVAAATYGLFMLPSFVLIAEGRSRALALITGGAIAANVLANFLLIPRFSAAGAAGAMALTQLLLSGMMLVAATRRTGGLSLSRVASAPVLGCVAIGGVVSVLGQTAPSVLVAAAAYALVLALVEWRLHPADMHLARALVSRQLSRVAS